MKIMQDKIAIITGAASGIGKAGAIRLAREGAKVSLIDRNAERLEETVSELNEMGTEALHYAIDIRDEDKLKEAIRNTADRWGGRIDTVFANAGILGTVSPIEHFPPGEFERTLKNNLLGTVETVKHAIPYMKEHGGTITVTSSVSGNRQFAQAGFSAYSTSKAAISAFAKMAALELSQYGIRVNAICPGMIDTNIFESQEQEEHTSEIRFPFNIPDYGIPLTRKPGKPEDVAGLLLYLASDEARHITGTEVYIDGAEALIKG